MPIDDVNYSTLENIRRKIRRITSSPSQNQITDADIDHYINTFVLYSFPEDIKLFNLKKIFTFYTAKNIDTYGTNLTDPNDPLYNFYNKYSFTGEPCFVNGIRTLFQQDRSMFYSLYPEKLTSYTIGTGDGVTTNFTGTLSAIPVLRGSDEGGKVIFSSIDNLGASLSVWDDGQGNLVDLVGPAGLIDYVTGQYGVIFDAPPKAGENITVKTFNYIASVPRIILFYDKKFILRPVPDDVYPVSFEVYQRPDALISANQMPELSQHWEYIAFGAARKIFSDRRDYESRAQIQAEFEELEDQVRDKATMQLSQQKAATFYDCLVTNVRDPFKWPY